MSADNEELFARFRAGFKLASEIAERLGQTILPNGTRVRARFPFCNHETLGTIKGCDEGSALPFGETFGYLVLLDDPMPLAWTPTRLPFVPYENVEVV